MSGNQRFVLFMLVFSVVAVSSSLFISGFYSLILAVFIMLMVFLLRPLVMPAGYGANKIRMVCLTGAFALVASWGGWVGYANVIIKYLLSLPQFEGAPSWLKSLSLGNQPSPALLIFIFGVIFVVNYFMRDKSISGGHPVPLKDDFPEESYKAKQEAFCAALLQDIITIDRATNWSPAYYTELQAEVEVSSSSGVYSRRRIINLQDAIRKDRKTQSFLILGTPGSGKSVALRKLAKDMLSESKKTNRIPIYINLREWVSEKLNNEERVSFDLKDLESFVIENVKNRGDVFTEEFVDHYFRKLWRSGRLFFIFDSFDEISELLDADENSDVINSLSSVISRFISTHPLSRGVLSSRIFRRPTDAFLAQKTLEIRPLSETGIVEALSRFPKFSQGVKGVLFRDRPDLIPLARNPFVMALLGSWIEINNALPANQAQIFKDYILNRLELCKNRLDKAGLKIDDVISVSTDIAWFVFSSSNFGLEAPIKVISEHFKSDKVDAVLNILDYARIARVTSGEEKSFAFVHRRFLEYFVTLRLLSKPDEIPVSHIPTDSRGRDALVLYAQLCDKLEAQRIADLCWHDIKASFSDASLRLRAIHCLRFLIDAFSSRREVIKPFENDLNDFVMDHITHGESIILAKICLESTGLLSESKATPILSKAIVGNDIWLQETAFRSCRHLPKMEAGLENEIKNYVMSIPDLNYWFGRKNTLLSLSLSDSLRGVYNAAKVRIFNIKLSFFSFILALILSPIPIVTGVAYAIGIALMSVIFPRKSLLNKRRLLAVQSGHEKNRMYFLDSLGRSVSSDIVVISRYMMALSLFVFGIMSYVKADNESFMSVLCAIDICHQSNLYVLVINIVLGFLILDWLQVMNTTRLFLTAMFGFKRFLLFSLFLSTAVFFACLIIWAVKFLVRYNGFIQVLKVVVILAVLIVMARFLIQSVKIMKMHLKDVLVLRKLQIPKNVTRREIAEMFMGHLTIYGQLKFVSKLEEARVSISGEWPSEFKLSIGLGDGITALARLEERWLKLDR